MREANKMIAVIGSAHPHVLQLALLARQAGFQVIGLYDDDAHRCIANATSLEVPSFDDLDRLLDLQPAVALVGSVPNTRSALAARCAQAGLEVLVDKPLALNLEDLTELKPAAASSGRRIIVYYPYRGHPYLRAAKAVIASGQIGELVCVDTTGPHCLGVHDRPGWHWERACNGDILIDIGAHGFDLCHWFAGAGVVDISARMGNFASTSHRQFRDFGVSTIRFANGVIGKVEVDWLIPSTRAAIAETRFGFQGTKGRIDIRIARESSGTVISDSGIAPLMPASGSMEQWTIGLLHALCSGAPCDIEQAAVWWASETSLRASLAARAEEGLLLPLNRRAQP